MGSLFTKENVSNGKDNYNAGIAMAIWCVFYLANITIGISAPNVRAITEGRINSAQALQIIN